MTASEILEINKEIERLVKQLEIGFVIDEAIKEGFLDISNSKKIKELDLTGDEIDFIFSQVKESDVIIIC